MRGKTRFICGTSFLGRKEKKNTFGKFCDFYKFSTKMKELRKSFSSPKKKAQIEKKKKTMKNRDEKLKLDE